ncbi:MAG: PQQ-binding-like beta-propeller repeat protein, partial [Planctomycetes bacterium]|nr:PQQ-binding-like beta-propeller repeat protein [Planctomycetota bacterium]
MNPNCRLRSWIVTLLAVCLLAGPAAANEAGTATAKKIVDAAGAGGGIVVHLGCGNGKLTAALRLDDRYTVHGLDPDPARIAAARSHVESLGVYGPVSVEQFSGSALPYTDNLVNLVVVQDAGQVAMEEVMRVLAPGGAAVVERGNRWEKVAKTWPEEIDHWGHFLHDATGNAVAQDTVVGPPRSLQWIAPPLWLRSHETPSGIQSVVSAAGRLFYFFDEGLIGITDERLPDRWSLICRDAFNGKLLWRLPLGDWGWREWARQRFEGKDWTKLRSARTNVPNENHRRIVAVGDRLYVTLAYRAGMSILEAATGKLLTTVEPTRGTSEILVADDVAVCYTQEVPDDVAQRRGTGDSSGAALVAVDGEKGNVLWRHASGSIRPLALAIDSGRVVYLGGKDLVALDLKSGRELWRVQPKWNKPRTLVAVDDVVVLHSGTRVAAHDATDGKQLWTQIGPPIGSGEVDDLFVVDGLVWRGMVCVDDEGEPTRRSQNSLVVGWDLRSGEEKKRILVNNLRSPEHHHRCYRNKATSRYLISSFEGAEFLDFQGDNHGQNNWLRGACRYGMVPCNGMLYVPSDQCFCQPGSKLLGYAAVKAGPDAPLEEVPDEDRLEEGPAYGDAGDLSSAENPDDWPTFRHDAARSGASPSRVPAAVAIDWKAEFEGKLTAPVAAGGKLFVARSDAHTVHALDAATGKRLWQFTANGRIDSPPTIHQGLVLFGSADGWVYSLRASDGQLAWRFLAAPVDRRVGYFDQVESAWPVHGSVVVDHGAVYFSAGRSTYLDG